MFISYRREDSSGHAGWLREALAERLGRDLVFMDIDTIEPGLDFVEVLERAVDDCDVLLVLIGKAWLTTKGADGRRRLDDPKDYHRLEVESALKRRIRVIPVLVQDATVPRAEELPPTLQTLARRHATELDDSKWAYDIDRLSTIVKKDLKDPSDDPRWQQPPPPPQAPPSQVASPQPPGAGEEESPGGARKKLLRRSAVVLVACLAVLGVVVVIGFLAPGGVTRERAEQTAVDFAFRNTPEGVERNELAASCSPSGDSWLCGVGSDATACTGGTVGAVTVASSGAVIEENLACEPPPSDPEAPPRPADPGESGRVMEGVQRAKFPLGESSTVLEGSVMPGERNGYLLEAQAGQQMTVHVTSAEDNAAFIIQAPGGAQTLIGAGESDDAMDWSGELPTSGDYKISVEGKRGKASYRLDVSIT